MLNKIQFKKWLKTKVKINNNKLYNNIPCLEWQMGITSAGYAHCQIDTKQYLVHRLVLFYKNGYFPESTDHLCRNRSCVAEEHIEAVTHKINAKRMYDFRDKPKFCPNGHNYTEKNPVGKCRICKNIRNQFYNDRRKILKFR